MDVAVRHPAGVSLSRVGDEVAGELGSARSIRGDERLSEAVPRMEDLLRERAQEIAEEHLDRLRPAHVGDRRLHADEVIRRPEDVVGRHLQRQIPIVRFGREGKTEIPDRRAGVDAIEEIVDADRAHDRGLASRAVVHDQDVREVGGVLEVDLEGPFLEVVATRLAHGPLEVDIDDLAAENHV